jgi:hypothetical protein
MMDTSRNASKNKVMLLAILAGLVLLVPCSVGAQNWAWTREVVDTFGSGMSVAVDGEGNVHISYGSEKGLTYGFRPAGAARWFIMPLGGGVNYTNLKIDQSGNPHICATYLSLPLRYAHYDGKNWDLQEIAPEDRMSVQAGCAVAIGPDGIPHLSWYRIPYGTSNYAHLRYAVLKDGVWQMQTLDFDMQTGKWNWMITDSQGNPYITYDAFVKGLLKLAHWDGKGWNIRIVDSRGAHGSDYSLGMGSSLVVDNQGNAHISYYSDTELRYARQEGSAWKFQIVEKVTPTGAAADYRSSLVLDRDGLPHVSYEDSGVLKHAYWDGERWRIEVIAASGLSHSRFNSMAVDPKQNLLYLAYRDPIDGSLKVARGRKVESPKASPVNQKTSNKN